MCKARQVVLLVATVGQLCWLPFAAADDADWVRVEPKETDEILANPGMGWETFHRTADDDKHLPSWIPSTIHYARWGWKVLEPNKGKIDYDFLDGVLKETRESGQQLAFRVMCCSPKTTSLTARQVTDTQMVTQFRMGVFRQTDCSLKTSRIASQGKKKNTITQSLRKAIPQ